MEDDKEVIYYYVIKLVKDLRQVGAFLRVLRFPPPIKLTATMKVSLYDGIFTTDQMLECI
jgi:hypothetical protein